MAEARLKTHIQVTALMRRAQGAGAFAHVARKGDPDAGAVAVKVFVGEARARLFMQSRDLDGAAVWRETFDGPQAENDVDARLTKERRVDPDLWIVEIEDKEGRSFLE
ncbi:MAG TPA: DUF1491 family protein [Parvularculaceae bacterium]|nr:DUF1491 family protein [Parvularculaceae bacterium]